MEEIFFELVTENRMFGELIERDNLVHLFEFIVSRDDCRLSLFLSHLNLMNFELENENNGVKNSFDLNNLLLK